LITNSLAKLGSSEFQTVSDMPTRFQFYSLSALRKTITKGSDLLNLSTSLNCLQLMFKVS